MTLFVTVFLWLCISMINVRTMAKPSTFCPENGGYLRTKLYFWVGFGRGKANFSDNLLRDPKSERECSEVRMFQSRKDF